jgi:hypothetical protein
VFLETIQGCWVGRRLSGLDCLQFDQIQLERSVLAASDTDSLFSDATSIRSNSRRNFGGLARRN